MNDFPISSKRLLLRYIRETDADAIFSYRSLPEVARFQYWEPFTKERTIVFINQCTEADLKKENQWIGLAIEYKGKVIGDCAFNISNSIMEIGCNISPEYQGMGLAKEALSVLIDHCFKNFEIKEVAGITDSRNTASIRLMESLAMQKVAGFENHIFCKGENCIEYKYSRKNERE
ncbi:N-acetyltransferase [Dysgonomonas sp. 521]|uniref:GNAT family N-acetyltransferase n=1 Tax=Dysgonomonas sp. 521 TaxID=2302932 RepID=UPI0013D1FB3C|nr:GNAT family protein [Dysgonomonas sp. 521]NDV95068.1 N-acetyltransferase [Dysgonomonas sp. 521]